MTENISRANCERAQSLRRNTHPVHLQKRISNSLIDAPAALAVFTDALTLGQLFSHTLRWSFWERRDMLLVIWHHPFTQPGQNRSQAIGATTVGLGCWPCKLTREGTTQSTHVKAICPKKLGVLLLSRHRFSKALCGLISAILQIGRWQRRKCHMCFLSKNTVFDNLIRIRNWGGIYSTKAKVRFDFVATTLYITMQIVSIVFIFIFYI